MKKLIFTLAALIICSIASAQFGRGPQIEPLPEGFKPASTNTFISQYPGVNAETRQAIFMNGLPGDVHLMNLHHYFSSKKLLIRSEFIHAIKTFNNEK